MIAYSVGCSIVLKVLFLNAKQFQERELKEFREGLKTELRLLRQEVDLMPKDKRKSVFRSRKEKLEVEHEERVSKVTLNSGGGGGCFRKLTKLFPHVYIDISPKFHDKIS